MQYLAWADIMIPLCFVTGFSYAKRARVTEHRGGFASSRGFEASEISVRVTISRAIAMAYGLDFGQWLRMIDGLNADPAGAQGAVTLGGYPVYPELNFALTNVNRTYLTDVSCQDISSIEADLTLSGVSCVKEVARQRALVFTPEEAVIQLPKVTIECDGESLVVQDSMAVSRFATSPDLLELEIFIGQDTQTPERASFLDSMMSNFATVTCELPQGTVVYNVISCMQYDNIMSLSGSIFPESASQVVTKTFVDCDIADILTDICQMIGIECQILISGHVDYYLMKCSPLEALAALRASAGFIVSRQGNTLTFAWVPDAIEPQKTLDLIVTDDSLAEPVGGVIWRDGIHEATAGKAEGGVIEVESAFRSPDGGQFAGQVLKLQRYLQSYIRIEDAIDETIGSHSQVAIAKNGEEIPALVDYPEFNWLEGTMMLECREIRP